MQVKKNTSNIDNLLKNYLFDGEQVEYFTQSTPEIAAQILKFKTGVLIFMCIIFIIFCIFAAVNVFEATIPLLICIFFFSGVICLLLKNMRNQLINFLPDYYFITNSRIIAYTPQDNSLDNYKFSNIRIYPKLKVSFNGKYAVEFSHYFDIIAFSDIPDAKRVYEFMKGKLNK